MFNSLWPESDPSHRALPEPTVDFRTNETPSEKSTAQQVSGILTNPVYAGVGPFPALVSVAQRWLYQFSYRGAADALH